MNWRRWAVSPTFCSPETRGGWGGAGGRRAPAAPARPSAPGPTAVPTPPSVIPTVRPSAAETVWVTSPQYRFGFSTLGGRLVEAQLLEYKSFAPGDSGRPVQLVPADRPLLTQWLVLRAGTVGAAGWGFTPSEREGRAPGDSGQVTLAPQRGAAPVEGCYTIPSEDISFAGLG